MTLRVQTCNSGGHVVLRQHSNKTPVRPPGCGAGMSLPRSALKHLGTRRGGRCDNGNRSWPRRTHGVVSLNLPCGGCHVIGPSSVQVRSPRFTRRTPSHSRSPSLCSACRRSVGRCSSPVGRATPSARLSASSRRTQRARRHRTGHRAPVLGQQGREPREAERLARSSGTRPSLRTSVRKKSDKQVPGAGHRTGHTVTRSTLRW